ncbi:hypothetical protein [Methanosarcina sp.]|uniref:hypothetical protein n=1 Tax=Methanosarcina sp. TaxID=2213 RepID=UPI0029881349|nr:hypothetical protein [Methanosarcina sp.]MDW5550496.1 hypothetical protein [Methanosarcina sp.]MDW5554201.1 hypothetical protein [Methanosarcina sp.]MDW5559561.1 hypothetical protein [Methanosarcina sp.]
MSIALSTDSMDFSSRAFGDISVNFFTFPGACPSSARIHPAFKASLLEFSKSSSSTVTFSSTFTLSRNCPPLGYMGASHRKRERSPE